jgi:hypothetical protein
MKGIKNATQKASKNFTGIRLCWLLELFNLFINYVLITDNNNTSNLYVSAIRNIIKLPVFYFFIQLYIYFLSVTIISSRLS